MGFFSSIGKAFKGLGSSVLGLAGDVVGGVLGLSGTKSTNDSQAALAQAQMAYQKELAQNQIQWRVEDAKKAGLHPLAALGISSASYSPVSANFQAPDYSFISDMGQNLNRAIMQGKTAREREQAQARQDEIDSINLRRARAEADHAETVAASERLRLQRELFPPAPKVNQNVDTQLPTGRSITSGTRPLLDAARVGNSITLHINHDISDAITEDLARNLAANIAAEAQMGRIAPEVLEHFTQRERDAVKRGDAVIEYSPPSQFFFRWKGHMRSRKNPDGSVSGRIIW